MLDRHAGRMLLIGLGLAFLAGYFVHWLTMFGWFRPIGGVVGIIVILGLTRWLAGRRD